MTFSAADKIEAVERELGMRRRVYERRLAEGKMSHAFAARQIGVFEEILEDYRAEWEKGRLL